MQEIGNGLEEWVGDAYLHCPWDLFEEWRSEGGNLRRLEGSGQSTEGFVGYEM
jgi:hypothetical protein